MPELDDIGVEPPLALVAEDNAAIRRNAVRRLERRGVEALEAESFEAAEATLSDARWPDVAIIDIHLDADNKESRDTGGLDIVRLLRNSGRPIQVVGYSGKFDEGSIDTTDLDLFDHIAKKGRLGRSEHTRLWETCAEFARAGFEARVMRKLDQHRRQYEASINDSDLLRHLERDAHGRDVDQPAPGSLGRAGFRLRIIGHEDSRVPGLARGLVIWLQHERDVDRVNVEVYRHPELYASGKTEDEAIATLGEFMTLTANDLAKGARTPRERALRDFLTATQTG